MTREGLAPRMRQPPWFATGQPFVLKQKR
jgi:hypothetical protein